MTKEADYLIDRAKLKSSVIRWKILTLVSLVVAMILVSYNSIKETSAVPHIARIAVDGIIVEDRDREQILAKMAEEDNIKAVILHINSPGGTMVGGENLYYSLKTLAAKKPLVVVMGGVAASGGYMIALPAKRIFASDGSITGSIGVLFQSADFVDLSKKLGVNFVTFKSGELKGAPSPFEKVTDNVAKVMKDTINDSYDIFVEMVVKNRKLSKIDAVKLADGRIYTGRQAVKNKLIDEIGRELEAVNWLRKSYGIEKDVPIVDWALKKEQEPFSKIFTMFFGENGLSGFSGERGIMAIYNP